MATEQIVRTFTKALIEITLALSVLLNIAVCVCECYPSRSTGYESKARIAEVLGRVCVVIRLFHAKVYVVVVSLAVLQG